MFIRYKGEPNIVFLPKKASTAFTNGGLTYADGSGSIQPADATSGDHKGIILQTIASTDSDYAANTKVMIDQPRPNDEFLVDVGTGSATSALIGTTIDLKDSVSADVTATSKNVLTVVDVISSSLIVVKVNAMDGVVNVATT